MLSMFHTIGRCFFNDTNLNDMWFQEDGTGCHIAQEIIALLQIKFPGRVVSLLR